MKKQLFNKNLNLRRKKACGSEPGTSPPPDHHLRLTSVKLYDYGKKIISYPSSPSRDSI